MFFDTLEPRLLLPVASPKIPNLGWAKAPSNQVSIWSAVASTSLKHKIESIT